MNEKAKTITGVHQWPYRAVARALEVIPRTLIQNCGGNSIRTLTALRVRRFQVTSCRYICVFLISIPNNKYPIIQEMVYITQ
jgi:T-complex protein 1 subunit gamma